MTEEERIALVKAVQVIEDGCFKTLIHALIDKEIEGVSEMKYCHDNDNRLFIEAGNARVIVEVKASYEFVEPDTEEE